MANPIDVIWADYDAAINVSKVVERCMSVAGVNRERAFANTAFRRQSDDDCNRLLAAARRLADEGSVIALYAGFEAHLREHLTSQATLLAAADRPDPAFGRALSGLYATFCARAQMDDVVGLFATAAGQNLVAQVGTIRSYRHWLAHGKRWTPAPPVVSPSFVRKVLALFVETCGLA